MGTARSPLIAEAGEQPRSRVLLNTLVVGGLTGLAKTAGALKTVVTARFFGASAALDAYLIAFLIPSFLAEVFSGAIVPSLVPRLVHSQHEGDSSAWNKLYAGALYHGALILAAAAALLSMGAIAVSLIAPRFGHPGIKIVCVLLLIMVPIMPVSAVANVWRSVLNAHRLFAIAAGSAVFTPLAIILFLFFGSANSNVYLLAMGTTAGVIAESIVLGIAVSRLGVPLRPRWVPWSREQMMLRDYGSLSATNFVTGGAAFVDQAVAVALGAGALSILNYGTRLTGVLIAMGPAALGVAILPQFSQLIAENDRVRLRAALRRALGIALMVSAAATAMLLFYSTPVTRALFERGQFTVSDTNTVAMVQRFSLLQLPFAVGVALLSRLVVSANANRLLVPLSAATLTLNAVLDLVLMRSFSVAGIALAGVAAQALMFTMLGIAVSRLLRERDTPC